MNFFQELDGRKTKVILEETTFINCEAAKSGKRPASLETEVIVHQPQQFLTPNYHPPTPLGPLGQQGLKDTPKPVNNNAEDKEKTLPEIIPN